MLIKQSICMGWPVTLAVQQEYFNKLHTWITLFEILMQVIAILLEPQNHHITPQQILAQSNRKFVAKRFLKYRFWQCLPSLMSEKRKCLLAILNLHMILPPMPPNEFQLDVMYSKHGVKQPLKKRQNKDLNDKW